MAIRRSKKDTKQRTCKLCRRKFVGKAALIDHLDRVHKDSIPEGWPASQYENFLRTGMTEGHCVECGEPTGWNESTWKYHRLCTKKSCREASSKAAKKNMIGMYGKEHLLDDPEMQKKMVYAKSTSKKYVYEDPDDPSITYTAMSDSSYGYDFFEMTDVFLNFNGRDITAPSPHVYYYEYEGKTHFYIPDAYIWSLNLEVELKDGGDNPNMHPKIQAVDKEKERLKDELMYSLRNQVNYIKIVNKDYSGFFTLLGELKSQDIVYLPKWVKPAKPKAMSEAYDVGRLFKKGDAIYNNPVTYSSVVRDLKKDIKAIETVKEYRLIEYTVNSIREHLAKLANAENEYSYEAGKAVHIIDSDLIPALEAKAKQIQMVKKKKAIATSTMEAYYPKEILMDPTKYQPVYVLLTKTGTLMSNLVGVYTKAPYTHTSFSFDETLTDMYSFTDVGMEHENIKTRVYKKYEDTTSYQVYAMMIETDQKENLHSLLTVMQEGRDDYRYSLKGIAQIVLKLGKDNRENAKFCSQFVAEVMQMLHNDIINKDPFYVRPMDFANMKYLYKVNEGVALRDYDPNVTRRNLMIKIRKGEVEV